MPPLPDPYRVSTPIPGLVDVRQQPPPAAPPAQPPPCDYCPPEHRRLAYRMVEAFDTDAWGRRTFHVQRFICAACEIRAWDTVLRPRVDAPAPIAPSAGPQPADERVGTLEEQVRDLQDQLKAMRRA